MLTLICTPMNNNLGSEEPCAQSRRRALVVYGEKITSDREVLPRPLRKEIGFEENKKHTVSHRRHPYRVIHVLMQKQE